MLALSVFLRQCERERAICVIMCICLRHTRHINNKQSMKIETFVRVGNKIGWEIRRRHWEPSKLYLALISHLPTSSVLEKKKFCVLFEFSYIRIRWCVSCLIPILHTSPLPLEWCALMWLKSAYNCNVPFRLEEKKKKQRKKFRFHVVIALCFRMLHGWLIVDAKVLCCPFAILCSWFKCSSFSVLVFVYKQNPSYQDFYLFIPLFALALCEWVCVLCALVLLLFH